jgi:hypothetical protein
VEFVSQGLFAGGGETRIDTVAKFIESTQRVLQKARTEEVLPGKLPNRAFRVFGFRDLGITVASSLAFLTRNFSYRSSQRCWDQYSPGTNTVLFIREICKSDSFAENHASRST